MQGYKLPIDAVPQTVTPARRQAERDGLTAMCASNGKSIMNVASQNNTKVCIAR
jgi:hypothetical protein